MFNLNALRNTGLAATLIAASFAAPVMAAEQSQTQGPSSTQSQPPQEAPRWGHGPMMGPGMMGGCGPDHGMGPMIMGGLAKHIEGWIAFLRTELKITEAQTPLFNTFADTLRAAAKSLHGLRDQMVSGEQPDTLPERLTRHEQMMTTHLEVFKKVKSAVIPLYNALSPDQKQTANSLNRFMMGMGMM
jgi:hypothetical protein